MHADVEHDARRPHPLPVQHAEAIRRVIEVTELLHQPLRIQRPALRVPRRAGEQPPPGVELGAVVDGLGDLQVMPRHTLVVHGGELAPRVELGDALGDRPPHATGAGEVVGGTGVIDPALLRRRDHALQGADGLRDVEVRGAELGDRTIAGLLHPPLERLGADELAGGVRLQMRDGLLHGGAGEDLVRDRRLLGHHAGELFATPLVGLVEVDGGAEESAGVEGVQFAPHGVRLARLGCELLGKEAPQLAVGDSGSRRVVCQRAGERGGKLALLRVGVRDEGSEEPVVGDVAVDLGRDLRDLAAGGSDPLGDAQTERLDVPAQRRRHGGEPGGHDLPVLDRRGGHQVEGGADVLSGGGDDVQIAQVPLRVVQFEVEAELGAEVGLGDLVDRVDGLQRRELVERGPRRRGDLLMTFRAQIAEPVVDLGAADVGAESRRQDGDRVDPFIGDPVDGGGGAGC